MDAKDKRIAELEAVVAAMTAAWPTVREMALYGWAEGMSIDGPSPTPQAISEIDAALASAPKVLARGPVIGACFDGEYDGANELRPGKMVLYVEVDQAGVTAGMTATVLARPDSAEVE